MNLQFYLFILFVPCIIVAQDTATYKIRNKIFITSIPHTDPSEVQVSSPTFIRSDKKGTAPCTYFYQDSVTSIKATGKCNIQNVKVGKWSYYYKTGKILGIAIFTRKGNKKGKWKYFSENGTLEKSILINRKLGILSIKGKLNSKIKLVDIKEPILLHEIE